MNKDKVRVIDLARMKAERRPITMLWNEAAAATAAYVREVRERAFPAPEHCYHLRGA